MQTRQDSPFSVPFPLLGAAILAVVAVFGPAGVSRALKLVAKIQKYESTARYRMGPDGKPLLLATYEGYRAARNPR